MSQTDIYDILKELGGKASTAEIRQRAKEKYPNRTLHQYVYDRLHKLKKKKNLVPKKKLFAVAEIQLR